MLSSCLVEQGYSHDLQQGYKASIRLHSIGVGTLTHTNYKVDDEGVIYALQQQANLFIHAGGKTALVLFGKAHYLELQTDKIALFGGDKERLPTWFKKYDWGVKVEYYETTFLPKDLGRIDRQEKTFPSRFQEPQGQSWKAYIKPRMTMTLRNAMN
jgi:hypothetical protein